MLVNMSGRALAWAGGVVAILAVAGLSAYLGVTGLGSGSELAGVISAFAGLAGLGIAVYGVIRAHKDAVAGSPTGPGGGQSVTHTTAGVILQIRNVAGDVRIGRSSSAAPVPSPAAPQQPGPDPAGPAAPHAAGAPSGGQEVADSNIGGGVTQLDVTGADVDIDR